LPIEIILLGLDLFSSYLDQSQTLPWYSNTKVRPLPKGVLLLRLSKGLFIVDSKHSFVSGPVQKGDPHYLPSGA